MGDRLAIEHTSDGYRLVVARAVEAPAESVWDVFLDTRRWPEWGPSITDVECADRRISAGSSGRVRTVGGLWLPFEITSCSDSRWTWQIGPIQATGHRIESDGEGCRAAFEIPLLAAPYLPVCWVALRRLAGIATDCA